MPSIKDKIAGLEFAQKISEGTNLQSLKALRDSFNALPPLAKEIAVAELLASSDPLVRNMGAALGSAPTTGTMTSALSNRAVSSGGGESARSVWGTPAYVPATRVSYSG